MSDSPDSSDPSESPANVVSVLPKDAIPSVDDPTFGDGYFGDPDDDVLVVEPERDMASARAYPIRILNYHEVVNDVIPAAEGDADPIAVTWCPIWGSGVVYDATVGSYSASQGNWRTTTSSCTTAKPIPSGSSPPASASRARSRANSSEFAPVR